MKTMFNNYFNNLSPFSLNERMRTKLREDNDDVDASAKERQATLLESNLHATIERVICVHLNFCPRHLQQIMYLVE